MELITLEDILKLSKDDLQGRVVCFPTDTVYGLGAMIDDIAGVQKIYDIKHREQDKPLAALVSNVSQLVNYVDEFTFDIALLIEEHWPGALTLIFHKTSSIDTIVTCGKETIAFRMPDSLIALTLIEHFGILATTSVNISGEKELNDPFEIAKTFPEIDYIITDKADFTAMPSTVVDVTTLPFTVIRQGAITL